MAQILRVILGGGRVVALAAQVGIHRATLSRWLECRGEPRLPQFLRLVEAGTQRLPEFVALLADPAEVPSIQRAWKDLRAQLHAAYELPWSHAVLRVLETEAYASRARHEAGWIAGALGISMAEEERCLRALLAAGQIKRTRRGFRVARVMTVDTGRDAEANVALKQHWASVALDRMRADATGGMYSYNLFGVSEEDYERLRALQYEFFDRMRAIIASSPRSERVVLANIQLLPLTANDEIDSA